MADQSFVVKIFGENSHIYTIYSCCYVGAVAATVASAALQLQGETTEVLLLTRTTR